MAILDLTIHSHILNCENEMKVFLPSKPTGKNGKHKVIWYQHGGNGDCYGWEGDTALFRHAEHYGYAIVQLSTYNSFGMNMAHGGQYADFLEKEVIPEVCRLVPSLSLDPEDNTSAGVSMGGFGAVRLAMNCPERFSKCAAFAGALAMPIIYQRYLQGIQPGGPDFDYAFGSVERLQNNENDILYMAKKRMENGTMIPVYMICGVDDFGFDLNDYMQREFIKMGVDVSFFATTGEHASECWEPHLPEFFEWLKRKEQR